LNVIDLSQGYDGNPNSGFRIPLRVGERRKKTGKEKEFLCKIIIKDDGIPASSSTNPISKRNSIKLPAKSHGKADAIVQYSNPLETRGNEGGRGEGGGEDWEGNPGKVS